MTLSTMIRIVIATFIGCAICLLISFVVGISINARLITIASSACFCGASLIAIGESIWEKLNAK